MPTLTVGQRIDIEQMAKRIVERVTAMGEMAEAEEDNKVLYEKYIASTDRLREEISIANIILDKLLSP
jgi:hypothetical protein